MDLGGRLSNPDLTDRLRSLTARNWKQEAPRLRRAHGVASDGRRKFGTVRDAIVAALEQVGGELRVRDLHEGVEALLGEPVSSSSVKDYLRKDSQRRAPLFEYCGQRGYRLVRN